MSRENERQFQAWVIDVAKRHGWTVKHTPTPMRPIGGSRFVPDPRGAGLPDLILFHEDPPRIIFAECKSAKGSLSDEQREVLRLLRQIAREAVDVDGYHVIGVYVWSPGVRSLIETILRSKAVGE